MKYYLGNKQLVNTFHAFEYFLYVSFIFLFLLMLISVWAQGQEVEFHEIEIQLFQEIDKSIMRSKFLIMIRSPDQPFFHEIEIA
jgi:hypothetical protein